jgi:UDP-glucose 4-epimerase
MSAAKKRLKQRRVLKMKVVVTGGAGFIASHIVDALVDIGHQVAVIDNLSTGKREYINSRALFYELDIMDPNVASVFQTFQPEILIHHAAQIEVRSSMLNPISDATTNIIGSIQLLEFCRVYGVRKIIYASSAAVYGVPVTLGVSEEHPIHPQSCYGVSKHTVEHYIDVYSRLYGLDYTILRYANVYGVRQDPKGEGGVISVFIDKWLHGTLPVIYGDGKQTRDFIYVKDVVQANLAALTKGSKTIVNIGTNHETSINELLALMNDIFNKSLMPVYKEKRPGDIEHSRLDNRLAKERLAWEPQYSLRVGLRETCEYYM